jgi:hypothetical protein
VYRSSVDPREPTARPPGMPRWVKALLVLAALLLLALVVGALLGVEHGPGMHS